MQIWIPSGLNITLCTCSQYLFSNNVCYNLETPFFTCNSYSPIDDAHISSEGVVNLILDMGTKNSGRHNDTPNPFLVWYAVWNSRYFTALLQNYLSTNTAPSPWKPTKLSPGTNSVTCSSSNLFKEKGLGDRGQGWSGPHSGTLLAEATAQALSIKNVWAARLELERAASQSAHVRFAIGGMAWLYWQAHTIW